MRVAIERALIPGSNTPNRPARGSSAARDARRDILAPLDMDRGDPPPREPVARGIDARRLARMPGRKQSDARPRRALTKILDLGNGGARRLFEHHVQPGCNRFAGHRKTPQRRGAKRDRIERFARDHFRQSPVARHALDRALRLAAAASSSPGCASIAGRC